MEIKFAGKTYLLPDVCASTNRQKTKLKRDLAEHGPEAFLASHKLSPLAGCVVDELAAAGAEVVVPEESADAVEHTPVEEESSAPDREERS